MEEKETKKIKVLSKMGPIDFIYLGVLFIFFILIIIIFFNSTSYIIKNVNKIFSQSEELDSHALDMDKYSLIEKKLNLPINNPNGAINTAPVVEVPVVPQVITTPEVVVTPEIVAPILDKKSLTISVLNGARKAGVAGTMATELETAGFIKATTGDSKTIYPITTILIKETKNEYKGAIEEAVKASHPKAVTKVNPTTSKFDIVVIVGKE